jgi:hypothetical protein
LRASGIGFYADNAEALEDEWVECFAEGQRSFRATACLGGTLKQQSRGYQIAMRGEILGALDERGNLVGI